LKPEDMIVTARQLVKNSGEKRPREADLRRAVSSAYYAMFHCLCTAAADLLIGGKAAKRSDAAWRHVYRALNHGSAKNACNNQEVIKKFPDPFLDFAKEFTESQKRRHDADYDPEARFQKSDVEEFIDTAETAIRNFKQEDTADRRAFVVWLLLSDRRG